MCHSPSVGCNARVSQKCAPFQERRILRRPPMGSGSRRVDKIMIQCSFLFSGPCPERRVLLTPAKKSQGLTS